MNTDIRVAFPESKGYSVCNLKYMAKFAKQRAKCPICLHSRAFRGDPFHLPWQDCEKLYKSRNNGAKRSIVW